MAHSWRRSSVHTWAHVLQRKKALTEIFWWQRKPVLYSSWAFTLHTASSSCGLERITSGLSKIFTSFKRQVLKQNSETWNNIRKYSYKAHSFHQWCSWKTELNQSKILMIPPLWSWHVPQDKPAGGARATNAINIGKWCSGLFHEADQQEAR